MSKAFIRELVNSARRHRIDYDTFIESAKIARKTLGLSRPSRRRHLPQLLTDEELRRFYLGIDQADNIQHQIMLRLLFFAGIRVSELTRIEVGDVDLTASKIFIDDGKGHKDRFVLFPDTFRLTLQTYIRSVPGRTQQKYLFESARKTKYSTRQIQRIVKDYGAVAEISKKVHPHLFRHQLLTWLTAQGLTDAEIQVISGHSSKASLEVYQHLSLKDTAPGYQEAMKKLGV